MPQISKNETTHEYTNPRIDYFTRLSQIQTAQSIAHYKASFVPYVTIYAPLALCLGIVAGRRLKFKKLHEMWKMRGFSKRGNDALALHNEELREAQLRLLQQRQYPSHDHFVPYALVPLIGALGYVGYLQYAMREGRMVRDIEREKFGVQDEGAYKLFARD